jgi:hypothetical protein
VLNAIVAPVEKHGESRDEIAILLGGHQFHAGRNEAKWIVCPAPEIKRPAWIRSHRADQLALLDRPGPALAPGALDALVVGGGDLKPVKAATNRFTVSEEKQRPDVILAQEIEVRHTIYPAAEINIVRRPKPFLRC